MTPWRWFAGELGDWIYDLACDEPSRDAAILTALRTGCLKPGDRFRVIEARSSEAKAHDGEDCVPFLRTRNEEIVVVGPDGSVGQQNQGSAGDE